MLQRMAKSSPSPRARRGTREAAPARAAPDTAPRLPRHAFADLAVEPPGGRPRRNRTGLPDRLKNGVEALSGLSLDGIEVHYNSPAPARLGALAYARGREIHLAPGQERHLSHEAWHLVQQAQGRVRPTARSERGESINHDPGLEREADRMGARAHAVNAAGASAPLAAMPTSQAVLQPVLPTADQFKQQFGQRHGWWGLRSAFTDPHLQAAHAAIGRYHSVPWLTKWRGRRAVNEHKLASLHAAQHSLYGFQNAQVANPGHPAAAGVAAMQDEIQTQHRAHIAETVAHHDPLWTPDSATMAPAERQRVNDLWSSVTTGTDTAGVQSNLTVHGQSLPGKLGEPAITPPGFQDEINANHARLLETAGGRDLIESLVRGNHPVDVRPSHTDDRADIGYVGTGRTRVDPGSVQYANREALASAVVAPGGADRMVHHPAHAGGPALETAYNRAAGKSSRVIMNPGIRDSELQHRDVTTHDLTGVGNMVPTPAFLVYGHELGHAKNVMRGAKKTAMRRDLYNQIPQAAVDARVALGVHNVVPDHEQSLMHWHNAEEHDVIESIENPLRDQHGLPRRKYH
jgi:hypothetical protein